LLKALVAQGLSPVSRVKSGHLSPRCDYGALHENPAPYPRTPDTDVVIVVHRFQLRFDARTFLGLLFQAPPRSVAALFPWSILAKISLGRLRRPPKKRKKKKE